MSKLNTGNNPNNEIADRSASLAQKNKPTNSSVSQNNSTFFSQADLQEEASSSAIQAIKDMKPF